MACRCSEIKKCEQDIRLLENELAQELRITQESCGQGTPILSALSQDLTKAVFVNNISRAEIRLSAIAKKQDGRVSSSLDKRAGELRRIRNKLSNYENEDRRYHRTL